MFTLIIKQKNYRLLSKIIKYFHFVSVEDNDTGNTESGNISIHLLKTVKLTQEDVKTKLKSLDKSKSVGCDSVHPHVLKECCMSLSYPLYLVFKKSIETGILPDM
jgi:hypothetical protein